MLTFTAPVVAQQYEGTPIKSGQEYEIFSQK
jgi:hypothetical protein